MEKPWRNTRLEYGETVKNQHTGKLHTGKPKTRYNGVVRETNWKGGKMFRKIADWASTESGKEVLTGVFWGFVGIIAVRLFCFFVCLATGYPADVWHIFG